MIFKIFLLLIFIHPTNLMANECKRNNQRIGIIHSRRWNKVKIQSIAEVELFSTNRDFIVDAYEEAEDLATTNIAKFIKFIHYDENNNILDFDIAINGKKKSIPNKKFTSFLVSKNYSTDLIIRGIKVIDRCYVPGEYVRVKVEVSTDSIKDAEALKKDLQESFLKQQFE